jgi:alanyl aminopeptidase
MEQPKQDLKLKVKSCPAWVQMNDNAVGYYQIHYQGDLFQKLTSDEAVESLSTSERVDFMGNVRSGVAAGRLQLVDELKLVELFHSDSDRHVVESALSIAIQQSSSSPFPKQWVPTNLLTNYRHFIESNFGARARQVGWIPRSDESDDVRLLRPRLVRSVATFGGDQELAKQGRELAEKWLNDHSSVDPNLVASVLRTAAYYGDKSLMDRYLAEMKKTTDRQARQDLGFAMVFFRDPAAINQAMLAVLAGDVPLMETGGSLLVFGGQISDATRKMPFEFMKTHYDEILAKRPTGGGSDFAALFPLAGASFCDAQSEEELKTFFEPRVDRLLGARHTLDETLEGIDVCIATRAAELESLEAFLRKY